MQTINEQFVNENFPDTIKKIQELKNNIPSYIFKENWDDRFRDFILCVNILFFLTLLLLN